LFSQSWEIAQDVHFALSDIITRTVAQEAITDDRRQQDATTSAASNSLGRFPSEQMATDTSPTVPDLVSFNSQPPQTKRLFHAADYSDLPQLENAGGSRGRPLSSSAQAAPTCVWSSCKQQCHLGLGGFAAACCHAHYNAAQREGFLASPYPSMTLGPSNVNLTSLGLFDLLGHHDDSPLPQPSLSDVEHAITGLRLCMEGAQAHTDSVFDNVKLIQPIRKLTAKKTSQTKTVIAAECRLLNAILTVAANTNRAFTLDIFRPNLAFWQDLTEKFLQHDRPLMSVASYSKLLNGYTSQLATAVGSGHALYPELTHNNGKPWHASGFSAIQKQYAAEVAAIKIQRGNEFKASATAQGKPLDPTKFQNESKALAVPVYLLEQFLHMAENAGRDLSGHLHDRLVSATALWEAAKADLTSHNSVSPSTRAIAKRQASKKLKSLAALARVALTYKQMTSISKDISAAEQTLGGIGVIFAQFCFMARASTMAGGEVLSGPGIQDDIVFNSAGMTYVIRFLKGWDHSTTHQGLRLPLHYQGPNTFKWEGDGAGNRLPHSLSPRNRALDIIKSAHELKLLTWIDSGNPEVQGNQKINKFLASIKATSLLEPADATRGDKRQTITSHSIRRAAVSMAMANGVNIANITRFVFWRDTSMPWTYIDREFVVKGTGWETFFAGLLDRSEQSA